MVRIGTDIYKGCFTGTELQPNGFRPNGRVGWTLQLLADRLVALTRLESLSYEAVRLVQ